MLFTFAFMLLGVYVPPGTWKLTLQVSTEQYKSLQKCCSDNFAFLAYISWWLLFVNYVIYCSHAG